MDYLLHTSDLKWTASYVKPNKLNYSNVLGLTYEAVTELILKLVLTGRSLSIYIGLST